MHIEKIVGALGFNQNRLLIIPSLNAVIVRQSEENNPNYSDRHFLSILLTGEIAPQYSKDAKIYRLNPDGKYYTGLEFLPAENLSSFIYDDSIWLADIDPLTGAFISSFGLDQKIDERVSEFSQNFNGAGFGIDKHGWSLFYDKPVDNQTQLWRAEVVEDTVIRTQLTGAKSLFSFNS